MLVALAKGSANLRREIVEFFSKSSKNQTTEASSNLSNDDSVIEVTNDSYKIPQLLDNQNRQPIDQNKHGKSVPYWAHQYVYSFSEINDASRQQKEFYYYFKNCFLRKEFIDLEGNSNYSFILLFDLLKEYENHKNIVVLENQLRLLGQFYPKTNSYALQLLARKMEAVGDNEGAARVNYDYQLTYYDYWKLGSKYKKKLSLTDDEVKILNRLSYSINNFSDIEFCCIAVIKLYLSVISELEKLYASEQTSLCEQLEILADVIARKHFRYRYNSQNYRYCLETTPDEIHSIIFKHCENAVRELYRHKRKLNVYGYYTHPEVQTEFENRITVKLNGVIAEYISQIVLPDEATEIELNAQNSTRWKIQFSELTTDFNGDCKQFVENILNIGKLNRKSPSVENIFFEASKFISKNDRVTSLSLYLYYLYYDLKSAKFDNKPLTKTIQKSLFKTNEQLHEFEVIVSEFLDDRNLERAVQRIPAIYVPKRKKINLDAIAIDEIKQQHTGTVELLNEYLQDEYEGETNTIKSLEINADEVKIEITQKILSTETAMFTEEIAFTSLHLETLELFYKNNLMLSHDDLEAFAKSNSAFKNQLIDNLNEVCYEFLDDVLIEEEEDYYVVNENYYRKIKV